MANPNIRNISNAEIDRTLNGSILKTVIDSFNMANVLENQAYFTKEDFKVYLSAIKKGEGNNIIARLGNTVPPELLQSIDTISPNSTKVVVLKLVKDTYKITKLYALSQFTFARILRVISTSQAQLIAALTGAINRLQGNVGAHNNARNASAAQAAQARTAANVASTAARNAIAARNASAAEAQAAQEAAALRTREAQAAAAAQVEQTRRELTAQMQQQADAAAATLLADQQARDGTLQDVQQLYHDSQARNAELEGQLVAVQRAAAEEAQTAQIAAAQQIQAVQDAIRASQAENAALTRRIEELDAELQLRDTTIGAFHQVLINTDILEPVNLQRSIERMGVTIGEAERLHQNAIDEIRTHAAHAAPPPPPPPTGGSRKNKKLLQVKSKSKLNNSKKIKKTIKK